ncbi:MAG: hypothetical protein Q8S71_11975 [Hydrogenophaga sp.]|nr:hypothetical protein [Hydrogenophaga sp.]
MSDGKLVFIRPADGTGRIVFADASEATVPDVNIGLDATFAGESADMPATVQLLWDAGVSRGEAVETRVHWQEAQPARGTASAHWQDAQHTANRAGIRWQAGQPVTARTAAHWQDSQRLNNRASARWQDAQAQRHAAAVVWQEAQRLRGSVAAHWQDGQAQRALLLARWQEAIRMRSLSAVRWQGTGSAEAMRHLVRHSSGAAVPTGLRISVHWQDARRPPAGLSVVVQPPPPAQEPCYDPATLGRLEFVAPWVAGDGRLVFVCIRGGQVGPSAPLFILPSRYYMAVHSLTAHRLPDMQPIRIFGATIRADKGSYGWTINVSATRAAFDQLAPVGTERAQLLIELDGLQFSGIVGPRVFDEEFGGRGCSITVSSRTVHLAGPKARVTQRVSALDRTAQQLALEALDLTGFALDWGLSDWLVPAGAWSHSGTPLGAVQTIVEAAGGYLQSHRTAATLQARHPYRDLPLAGGGTLVGAPWYWNHIDVVPDVELPPGVLTRIGVEEDDGPDVNGVYLQGTHWGNWALYKRAGTAADKLASPVTDPLLTDDQAHRQRGRSIVGQAGLKQRLTYELPVITSGVSAPGVLDVGQLIQINEAQPWRGMVRSVSVSAPIMGEVRQTVEIERHLQSA